MLPIQSDFSIIAIRMRDERSTTKIKALCLKILILFQKVPNVYENE